MQHLILRIYTEFILNKLSLAVLCRGNSHIYHKLCKVTIVFLNALRGVLLFFITKGNFRCAGVELDAAVINM